MCMCKNAWIVYIFRSILWKKSYKTCFSRISMGNDIFPLKRKIKKIKSFHWEEKLFFYLPPLSPLCPLIPSPAAGACVHFPLFSTSFLLLHFTLLYISCSHWIKKNFFQSLFLCVFKLTLESLFSFPLINSRERLQGERRRAVSNVWGSYEGGR